MNETTYEIVGDRICCVRPIFDGRGYLATVTMSDYYDKYCHMLDPIGDGKLRALMDGEREIYLSADAYLCLVQWLYEFKSQIVKRDGWRYKEMSLSFGNYRFKFPELNKVFMCCAADTIDAIDAILGRLNGFQSDEEQALWTFPDNPELHRFTTKTRPSVNRRQVPLLLDYDNGRGMYDIVLFGEQQYPIIAIDLTNIKLAETLRNIANTVTYPETGYGLNLALGFGNIEIGQFNKTQLRNLAETLIP